MSKKHKAHRASVQRAIAEKGTVPVSADDNLANTNAPSGGNRDCPPAPHQLRGLARREWIEQQAQAMYRRHVGDTIDVCIEAAKHTAAAFNAQMREARGEGESWGPDVTPYENRMTGSLLHRLLREKRTWLREFRQQIEQSLKDEAAFEEEQVEAEAAASAPDSSRSERTAGTHCVPRTPGHQAASNPEASPNADRAKPEFRETPPDEAPEPAMTAAAADEST